MGQGRSGCGLVVRPYCVRLQARQSEREYEEERREFHYIVRKTFFYLAIAVVPVTALFALTMHDVDAGIQRNIRQNWLLCSLTAFLVVGFSAEAFWGIRRVWQMWGVLAAYTALHFSIGVPALAHMNKIRGGYISLIVMPELLLVFFILSSIEERRAHVSPQDVNE